MSEKLEREAESLARAPGVRDAIGSFGEYVRTVRPIELDPQVRFAYLPYVISSSRYYSWPAWGLRLPRPWKAVEEGGVSNVRQSTYTSGDDEYRLLALVNVLHDEVYRALEECKYSIREESRDWPTAGKSMWNPNDYSPY